MIFIVMLLLAAAVMPFISSQLIFKNGVPQNTVAAAYFTYVLSIVALEVVMFLFITTISLILWFKLSKVKKYLKTYGKEVSAKITEFASLGGSIKFFYIIKYELEYQSSHIQIIDFSSHLFKRNPGDHVQILIDPNHKDLAAFIKK